MTNAILRGKPDAGNPHVRFDEGEVASAKPRRGSLLYKVDFPDWTGFTPEFAAAELPRLLDGAEKAVSEVESGSPLAYEDFVWALDDATRDLWRCWGMVSHMLGVMNSEAWRTVEEEWQPKIVSFSLRVGQSKKLYEIAKLILNANSSNGDSSSEHPSIRPSAE